MSNTNDSSINDVGFGKPPKHTRFRKGRSGNPRGRPKGRLNLATLLERVLQEEVVIKENGLCRTVSKFELALQKLVDLAAKGDVAALRLLTSLVSSAAERDVDTLTDQLAAADLEVLQGVLSEAAGRRLAETYLSRHKGNLNENENAE